MSAEAVAGEDEDERTVVRFSPARRRTAEHMVRSKATSPHAFVAVEADYEAVEAVRAAAAPAIRAAHGCGLSYLPFVAHALTRRLADHPALNSTVVDGGLELRRTVNLGVAVDLGPRGLIVPVVHDAGSLGVEDLTVAIAARAEAARARRLMPADVADGTFTVTNLGMFGTTLTVPIINQPQVAILATDGVARVPVVDDAGQVVVRRRGTLGLSFDHRAVDGAEVARFLRSVADTLSTHDWAAALGVPA